MSPPRVQRGVDDHPAERAVPPLIVWIRVRSLVNAWSAVCLVLISEVAAIIWRMQTAR